MAQKRIEIPEFETRKELFDFLETEKDMLIAQKKAIAKESDGVFYVSSINDKKEVEVKANEPIDVSGLDEIKVRVVINTTNLMDSHDDVHIPNLWNKSLKENKMIMFLQEHIMKFDKIIADSEDLNAFVKTFTWKSLGFDLDGSTQALVFDATIKRSRNEFMFEQYAKGFIKNHSVGMRYVKIGLAVNDEDRVSAFALWEKYIDEIANKDLAIEKGYFWAVTEAKIIEGSAVPLGSNFATPTLENNKEPLESTQKEPSNDTQQKEFYFNYLKKQ